MIQAKVHVDVEMSHAIKAFVFLVQRCFEQNCFVLGLHQQSISHIRNHLGILGFAIVVFDWNLHAEVNHFAQRRSQVQLKHYVPFAVLLDKTALLMQCHFFGETSVATSIFARDKQLVIAFLHVFFESLLSQLVEAAFHRARDTSMCVHVVQHRVDLIVKKAIVALGVER